MSDRPITVRDLQVALFNAHEENQQLKMLLPVLCFVSAVAGAVIFWVLDRGLSAGGFTLYSRCTLRRTPFSAPLVISLSGGAVLCQPFGSHHPDTIAVVEDRPVGDLLHGIDLEA